MDHLRVYAAINAAFSVGQIDAGDWDDLTAAALLQPMSAAIMAAAPGRGAQCRIATRRHSANAAHLYLNLIMGFECHGDDVVALLDVLDEEAAAHGVVGSTRDKFAGVFQAELRAAAVGLGYTQTNADKLTVALINAGIDNTFRRNVAKQQAQAYIADNAAIWLE
jgi:hypothetical protein